MTRALETAFTRIEGRPTGPLVANRGAKLLTTPRLQLIHSAAPKGGVAAERIDHELYRFPLPSTASTMLRNESATNCLWTSRTNI
jgi:hypothetical protein